MKITIPNYAQLIEYTFKALKELKIVTPKWIEFNAETLTGKIIALPERDDIDLNIKENLIVEYYSR